MPRGIPEGSQGFPEATDYSGRGAAESEIQGFPTVTLRLLRGGLGGAAADPIHATLPPPVRNHMLSASVIMKIKFCFCVCAQKLLVKLRVVDSG